MLGHVQSVVLWWIKCLKYHFMLLLLF